MANLRTKAEKIESYYRIVEAAYEQLSQAIDAELPEVEQNMMEVIDHMSATSDRPYAACITVDGLCVACARHTIGQHLIDKCREIYGDKDPDLDLEEVQRLVNRSASGSLNFFWQM